MTTYLIDKIKTIRKIDLDSKRYDITVAKNSNFFANGILVHNCQNLSRNIEEWRKLGLKFHVSEKLDGQSASYFHNGEFGVCSKNFQKKENDGRHWQLAKLLQLEQKLSGLNIALQGEIVGPKIQGNHYKLPIHRFYVFDIFGINSKKYFFKKDVIEFCHQNELDYVPIVYENMELPSLEEILSLSDGTSKLANVPREGLVWVTEPHISFKSVSNQYLLKE